MHALGLYYYNNCNFYFIMVVCIAWMYPFGIYSVEEKTGLCKAFNWSITINVTRQTHRLNLLICTAITILLILYGVVNKNNLVSSRYYFLPVWLLGLHKRCMYKGYLINWFLNFVVYLYCSTGYPHLKCQITWNKCIQ